MGISHYIKEIGRGKDGARSLDRETTLSAADAAVRVQEQLEQLSALHPLGLGQPAHVAAAVVHLLGAPWTTGSELVVDGGLTL